MFRFSIRDVLWLTVVVALAVGWWLDHRQITPHEREVLKRLNLKWESVGTAHAKTPIPNP